MRVPLGSCLSLSLPLANPWELGPSRRHLRSRMGSTACPSISYTERDKATTMSRAHLTFPVTRGAFLGVEEGRFVVYFYFLPNLRMMMSLQLFIKKWFVVTTCNIATFHPKVQASENHPRVHENEKKEEEDNQPHPVAYSTVDHCMDTLRPSQRHTHTHTSLQKRVRPHTSILYFIYKVHHERKAKLYCIIIKGGLEQPVQHQQNPASLSLSLSLCAEYFCRSRCFRSF